MIYSAGVDFFQAALFSEHGGTIGGCHRRDAAGETYFGVVAGDEGEGDAAETDVKQYGAGLRGREDRRGEPPERQRNDTKQANDASPARRP